MHHGYGNLEKAIMVLDNKDKKEFSDYVNKYSAYHPHIMFIAKPELIDKWFSTLFPWLERCEEVFGFKELAGYDTKRLYAFLAERYMSFWFIMIFCLASNNDYCFLQFNLPNYSLIPHLETFSHCLLRRPNCFAIATSIID